VTEAGDVMLSVIVMMDGPTDFGCSDLLNEAASAAEEGRSGPSGMAWTLIAFVVGLAC